MIINKKWEGLVSLVTQLGGEDMNEVTNTNVGLLIHKAVLGLLRFKRAI